MKYKKTMNNSKNNNNKRLAGEGDPLEVVQEI